MITTPLRLLPTYLLVVCACTLTACGGTQPHTPSASTSSTTSSTTSTSSSTTSTTGSSSTNSSSSSTSNSSSGATSLYPSYNTSPIEPDINGMTSTAMEIADRMTIGWNIGNTLEAIGGETNWGNAPITNELIQAVKAAGFDSIRIPVSWNQYANQETAEISEAWLDRVKQVVQYCVDNDMITIVNIHWDGGWLENDISPDTQVENNAKQKAFWEQIATHLREFDERLLFAGANEPNSDNPEQQAVLDSYFQTFVDAVRSTGGKNAHRVLIIQGAHTDIEDTRDLWTGMPTDSVANKLMAEVHFYTPFNFTLMSEDQSWGNQFYYWGEGYHSPTDTSRNATWGEEAKVDELLAITKRQFIEQGIPVIVGEYGAQRRDELSGEQSELQLASRAYYLEYVTRQCLENDLKPFYWDSGGLDNSQSGLFNRATYEVFDQQGLDAIMRGAGKL